MGKAIVIAVIGVVILAVFPITGGYGATDEAQRVAQRILDETGVKGGLIVHVGCGDGKLTAALHTAGSMCLLH